MDKNNYCLYSHTVKQTGKSYVGITKLDTGKRWNGGMGYKSNTEFFKDIVKYGWDNMEHTVLNVNLSKREAMDREEFLISKFNLNDSRYGYNIDCKQHRRKKMYVYDKDYNLVNQFESMGDANKFYGLANGTLASLAKRLKPCTSTRAKGLIFSNSELNSNGEVI